jgi:hypothetical protein
MKTPFLGSSYVARSVNAADNRMVNLYPEVIPEGGKEAAFLTRAPGLRLVATVGTGPIRGMLAYGGFGYVVSGVELYRIDQYYNVTLLGTVSGSGPVSMADNGDQLFVACDPKSYIYNATTGVFQEITDPDFPGAKTVSFLDGYFVFSQPDSQKFWVTSLLDGTSVDPLDFASAEGSPDRLVSLIVDHREVWLFGTSSVEVWYNAGGIDFPLERIQGAFNELGCAAAYSVAKLDNALFWLGADARGKGIVYRSNGYTGTRVSTHAIEWQIQNYSRIDDAIGYTYQQDGHSFYVLTFPTANATWVFDVATGAWHERASWITNRLGRHRSNCQMAYNGEVLVGDYQNGKVYAFDMDVHSDAGEIQKWVRSWRALPTGQNNLNRTAHHALQLDCETGVGLNGNDEFDFIDLATEDSPEVYEYLLLESGDTLSAENGDLFYTEYYPVAVSTPLATESDININILDSVATVGALPRVMLRWSDDGGHTWSNEHWREMGRIGEHSHRVIWRRLGMTLKLRDRVYEVSGTDPVKIALLGAELQLSPTSG